MPATVMATIEAVASFLFYPLAVCAQLYRVTGGQQALPGCPAPLYIEVSSAWVL